MEAQEYPNDAASLSIKPVRELALSAAWHGGLTRSLVDTEGRQIDVVFPGNWSHGHGPDFTDAMVEIPGVGLVTGSIELHHHASDWLSHGHHLDQRYNDVIVHVVGRDDLFETRAQNNALIPMAVLAIPDEMLFRIDARLPEIWAELGGDVCAEAIVIEDQATIRADLQRLGDRRLHDRVTTIEGDLHIETALDLLTRLLFDSLGYSENRQPMQTVARAMNRNSWISRVDDRSRFERGLEAEALVFGIAGYLPLSPGDAHLAGFNPERVRRIEQRWEEIAPTIDSDPIPATNWVRARTRPANHPPARLALGSRLLASFGKDPVGDLLHQVAIGTDLPNWLQTFSQVDGRSTLGASRSRTIVANVLLPLTIALAHDRGDDDLEDNASSAWNRLPIAEWTRPAKRAMHQIAGRHSLNRLGERGHQGLLKLDRDFCTPRKCFECPIAATVVRDSIMERQR